MLFVVLLSNVLAVFLQALSIKLGTVSGLNLAEACRAFLPKWMNRVLYLMVQTAIIATGFAEVSDRTPSRSAVVAGADHDTKVITAAMILNVMLPNHVLARDCLLFIAIVLPVVFLYAPERWRFFRLVKFLFMSFIVAVVVCFSFELHLIKDVSPADVFRGYLPSAGLVGRFAVHQACSIIGATLVPHPLYLGSGIVQPRLRNFDVQAGNFPADRPPSPAGDDRSRHPRTYQPSLAAIRHCFDYSVAELVLCLFTLNLFVSSAVLIVGAFHLYGRDPFIKIHDDGTGRTGGNVLEQPPSLIDIYRFLRQHLSPTAGTVLGLALIFSSLSAGMVCTIAGQMLNEGALWRGRWWVRYQVMRWLAILPSLVIVVAAAADRERVVEAMKWGSVVQGVVLPFVVLPLVYFTSMDKCECCFSRSHPLPGPRRWCLLGSRMPWSGDC